MEREHLKLVIVGHVDHGKSTLIGRLIVDSQSLPEGKMEEIRMASQDLGKDIEFAFLVDHLQEEREEGLTIDTAQIFFKTEKRDYVIIDAPGHVEFIKNMITGASQAEAGILIVSAEEGIKEQTQRHAYIMSMLGMDQVIVVINKMDLVGYNKERFEYISEELFGFLSSINVKPSYTIPISAKNGDNILTNSVSMEWYEGPSLMNALDSFRLKKNALMKPMRFSVQDAYKIYGEDVFVGRVESGIVKEGQAVLLLPSRQETRIRSIRIFGGEKKEAEAGESIGVTLKDPMIVDRGMVVSEKEDLPEVTDTFRANIFWVSPVPFYLKEEVSLRCATQKVACTVGRIEKRLDSSTLEILEENAQELHRNEVGLMVVKARTPLVIEKFHNVRELGRFVLERDHDIVAGGTII